MRNRIADASLLLFTFALLATLAQGAIVSNVLSTPLNGSNTSNATPDFIFTSVSTTDTTFNCTVFVDAAPSGTSAAVANGSATTITANASLTQASHAWNVTCTDTEASLESSTYFLTVDSTAPVVTYNSPANNTNSTSPLLTVNFTVTDNLAPTLNCNLTTDEGIVLNASVLNNTATLISKTFAANGAHNWSVACADAAGTGANAGGRIYNFDNTSLSIYGVTTNQTDIFYSNESGNNVLTLIVNASDAGVGIQYLTANFTALGQPTTLLNMTNYAGTMWNASITITSVAGVNFQAYNLSVFGQDNLGNGHTAIGQGFTTVLLYNQTYMLPDAQGCMQRGAATSNLATATDFNHVNLVLEPKINLSCQLGGIDPAAPAWMSQFMTVALLNFTSVNFTDPATYTALQLIPSAIQISIVAPGEFGDSRIFFNATALAALSTNTTITLYRLPFTSRPAIEQDVGAAGFNGSSLSWAQGATDGNLTFSVYGFSGYNVTDNSTPTIAFVTPVNGSITTDSTPQMNVSLNGTMTQISEATFTIGGTTFVYNSTTNTANCFNVTAGSERFTCLFNWSALTDGAQTLTVAAWDYGGVDPGNTASSSVSFTVDTAPPAVTINTPAANSWHNSNFTINVTITESGTIVKRQYTILNATGGTHTAWTNLTNSSGYWTAAFAAGTEAEGNYTLQVNATDSNGFVNDSVTAVFWVDRTSPSISSFSLSDSSVEVGDSLSGTCLASDSLGGVSTSITGISTSSAGSKTATCTATDSAGNTATSTASYTVASSTSSSDSGGGSGASYAAVTGSTVFIDSIPAGTTATFTIPAYGDIAFGSISFAPSASLSNVEITVKHYDVPPFGSTELANPVYQYLQVEEKGITGVTAATITFKVDLAWIESNDGVDAVSLYRWNGNAWNEYKPTLTSKDGSFAYFTVTVPGLSIYAIGKSSQKLTAPTPTTAPGTTPATPAVETAPAAPGVPVPSAAPKQTFAWLIVIAVLVVVAVVVFWVASRRRAHKRHGY
ncbi:PGF-pre-PGF domain-containing protein [Candidatus Woesearchaeota archaeon]|nr:PGF-pre-PGF domain-containing protein [Candidatus Woesearchaeota archaeon]